MLGVQCMFSLNVPHVVSLRWTVSIILMLTLVLFNNIYSSEGVLNVRSLPSNTSIMQVQSLLGQLYWVHFEHVVRQTFGTCLRLRGSDLRYLTLKNGTCRSYSALQ